MFTRACAWEIKLPEGKLSPEQEALRPKLEANGWSYRIIRSVDEALAELKAMGVE